MGSRAVLCALAFVVVLGATWTEPVAAQREDWPTDCTRVMSSATIFIGHDCGEWASIMIVGRIEMRKPWIRTTQASRAVRIRERREGRAGGDPRPAASEPTASGIPIIDLSGGNSPELDCEDFATRAEAQAYFDANGWSAENDPFQIDQGGIPDAPCQDLP